MYKDVRKIIAKEIELGFLRVPVSLKKYFPKSNEKVICILSGKRKDLAYNPKYGRLFGLVNYFRENDASPNDIVEFEIYHDKVVLNYIKLEKEERGISSIEIEDADEIINVSDLSTQAKGNIVEQRIAELLLLYGQGLLNVYKPIADIEGIDLIVVKRGIYQPIFIQVKSRYNLSKNNLQIRIKKDTFRPHHSFFVVGAYFNPKIIDIDQFLLFIPSEDLIKKASSSSEGQKNQIYAISCPLNSGYSGIFSNYIIKKENLVNNIFEKFKEMEKYIK